MTGPHIAVLGDGVEAWLFAALFRQISRRTGTLFVIPVPERIMEERIALPPAVTGAHQLLRIAPDILREFGKPRYGIRIAATGGETLIPYGSYGEPAEPGNLVDAWIRLRSHSDAPALPTLSANTALDAGGLPEPNADPRLLRSISAGWEVNAGRYRALLREAALARGAQARDVTLTKGLPADISQPLRLIDGTPVEADLIIDAREVAIASDDHVGWHGKWLRIGTSVQRSHDAKSFAIPAVLSAAARLASLFPRLGTMPLLAREYNRLLAVEQEGFGAASAMLARLAGQDGRSETLDRYSARYRFAGLLPAEPQPWTRDMWLAAFDAMGWRPGRYDPNLDRFDPDRSRRRFDAWAALVDRDLRRAA